MALGLIPKTSGRLIGLFAILAAGLLVRLLFIRYQIYDNEDDLFLYLTIARQWKLTGMISFDGLAPTSNDGYGNRSGL